MGTSMEESELFRQSGLSAEWVDEFVRESNKIDPQPGPSDPGSDLYDGHRAALLYAIRMASDDRYAIPREVHKLLLGDHKLAGILRTRELKIGVNPILKSKYVAKMFWLWNRDAQQTIDSLRVDDDSVDPDDARSEVWRMHVELMNIHPYELYNGKVGRVLMVNHALLVDVEPWIIPCALGREDYFDTIRHHPSVQWGTEPPPEAF